jgi:thymidine phosphorylase
MVAALGGPNDLLEAAHRYLPRAQAVVPVAAPHAGYVAQIDCRRLGLAVVALGGGRRQVDDSIDYSVGLTDLAQLGQRVERGEPVAFIHARDRWSALDIARDVQEAYTVHAVGAAVPPHVYEAFD